MSTHSIVTNPKIMMGKPTIAGTRITVESILERLGQGHTIEDILIAHPHLTLGQVQAALAYAARVLRCDEVYPVEDDAA